MIYFCFQVDGPITGRACKWGADNRNFIVYQKFLKPFNKFAVRVLSSLKHSAAPCVLNLIKHCCSFIKHYLSFGVNGTYKKRNCLQ